MSNHELTRMNTNSIKRGMWSAERGIKISKSNNSALRTSHSALACLLFFAVLLSANLGFAEEKPIYENNFDKAEIGKVPEDFQVIDGGFEVKEENGNKFLELPGAPLDTFGTLFGASTNANLAVSAKIFSTSKGRRFPAFAVGLNGVAGYKLQVSPGKKLLELLKGDEVVKSVAYEWKSGEWTEMRLQARPNKEGQLTVCGKAWTKGSDEPKEWLCFDDMAPASTGRPSIWGTPYSGNPIQFDDLRVTAASTETKAN